MDSKPWWQSKTIWGSLVAGFVTLLKLCGIDIGDLAGSLPDEILAWISDSIQLGGILFAIYGRLVATKKIAA